MQNPSAIRTRTRPSRAATPPRELPITFILLVIACACVVAAGFFLAARQHFNSMDYGIKNSKLREQLQNLETEKRRLLLAREVSLSPLAMRKAAKEIGLRDSSDTAGVAPVQTKATPSKPSIATVENATTTQAKPVVTHAVVKTAMSTPTMQKPTGEVRSRVVDSNRPKKEKTEVAALIRLSK